ncbi:MAG: helix-hairpin-helix domain-containing protein [Clostridia bacterium]
MNKTGRIILILTIMALVAVTIAMAVARAVNSRDFISREVGTGIVSAPIVKNTVRIYVAGEVVSPGIIEIEKGSTILDAVEACGGFTEDASPNINLVYVLNKNVTLVIKSNRDGGGAAILENAGEAVVIEEENGIIEGRININNADIDALCMLPGIGEATAADIISHREKHGRFNKIEDIMNVKGIKESKFEKIEDYICVE